MVNFFESFVLNLLTTIFFVITFLVLLYYIGDHFKLFPILKKYALFFKNYLFIIFIIPAFSFLCIDLTFPEFKTIPNYEFIKDLCKILFSAGIFTTTLSFLDSLNVFKKNFKDIIMSKDFENLLTKKIDALAYSKEHLNKQANLEKIWQTVTLCKYEQEFPELYAKLENKIENSLFKRSNISYYYKNFQISFSISVDENGYVTTLERTSFTIVRPKKDNFTFDFSATYNHEDPKAKVDVKFFSKNADEIDFSSINILPKVGVKNTELTFEKVLSGHLEYHIESIVTHTQNINNDRIFIFSSDRIIDDLTVYIENKPNIKVTFVPTNNNKFYHNGTHDDTKMSYINRDVLLSGQKFILFYHI